ncbi:TPA: hypothetical protein N2934_001602 [Vibrio parahaemolyticus]|uniref:hypothetical protein n=1 Tax=Vibrio harveyi group TaxID=717610 RepID=UPI00186A13DB|nr:hypothetical protein [Vibrio parahaemolyticus]EIA1617216.1 hypothetical protein [Vibrio parahaemolyticus]MBE4037068.1 hypothetical protein [Vibrio parahaemolyticus]MCR9835025.1 hypothetical protein [Vibrio parahaemolyticus]HCH5331592.1 hypothetical protein [Vibrio parahaemolyticus]HCM1510695.1 hypothetical protein [Vibrio parahaemolyticus]
MTISNVAAIEKAKARALAMLERSKNGTYKSLNLQNKPARYLPNNEPTLYTNTKSY